MATTEAAEQTGAPEAVTWVSAPEAATWAVASATGTRAVARGEATRVEAARRLRTLGEQELVAAPVLAVTPRGAVRAASLVGRGSMCRRRCGGLRREPVMVIPESR